MSLLDRARTEMGTDNLQAALDDIAVARQQAKAGAVQELDFVARLAAEVMRNGIGDDPDQLGQRLLDNRTANERADATTKVLLHIERQTTRALREARRTGLDRGLEVLRVELAAILEEAGPVFAALGENVDTADQAVEQDQAAEWRAATALADRYSLVRDVQKILTSGAVAPTERQDDVDPAVAQRVDCYGCVKDGEQHAELHTWATWSVAGQVRHELMRGRPAREKPVTPPWLTVNRVTALRFLTRPDVKPWVPTPDQLDTEQRRVADAQPVVEPEPRPDMGTTPSDIPKLKRQPMVQPASAWRS